MKRFIEGIKMKMAVWLDKRRPDWCWAQLVLWAMGINTLRDSFGSDGSVRYQMCRNLPNMGYAGDTEMTEGYCGKCKQVLR